MTITTNEERTGLQRAIAKAIAKEQKPRVPRIVITWVAKYNINGKLKVVSTTNLSAFISTLQKLHKICPGLPVSIFKVEEMK